MNNNKVYWVSRHEPLPAQIKELQRLFGAEMQVIFDPQPFDDANDIARRFRRSGAIDLVIVAPMSVCNVLLQNGIAPLMAHMEQVDADTGEDDIAVVRGRFGDRYYKFLYFKRVLGVEVKTAAIRKPSHLQEYSLNRRYDNE